jgi:hypothetical protein
VPRPDSGSSPSLARGWGRPRQGAPPVSEQEKGRRELERARAVGPGGKRSEAGAGLGRTVEGEERKKRPAGLGRAGRGEREKEKERAGRAQREKEGEK